MATSIAQTRDVISFGPFRLVTSERLLTREGAPVDVGGRSLDILIALLSSANEVVSKQDLLARVWPDVTVEEGSLRFHVASLRKALGDGKNGARYITTLAGRGYCFVAPVSRSIGRGASPDAARPHEARSAFAPVFPHANLPVRLSRMVGRGDDILTLASRVRDERFVTIVGAGGVGKTTVAVAVGHDLTQTFAGHVLFVDLGMLNNPKLVPTVVASMLGLSVHSADATPNLIAYLRDKRIFLILDTCEHLIDAVASLASRIFVAAPEIHILATSREALQVEGEHVYKLDPLGCPPEQPGLTAAAAQAFPATQLFVDRAVASGARLDFNDTEAAIVAAICRRLDGVPLAIELAARRVEAYGLEQTAALLDQRLTLQWLGPRDAPPRQRTLHATLDWSYGLLSELERVVLRRLAVFVGHFTMDAALAVATSETIDQPQVFSAIDSLIAKSMVATRPVGASMRYRLLDTTRAYALDIAIDDTELADLAVRHADYYRQWLAQSGTEWPSLSSGEERVPHFTAVNNVRTALEWCFGDNGNHDIGVELAAAAAPVFLVMSLLPECHRWSDRATAALDGPSCGGLVEMRLQAALGVSLMFTRGGLDAARRALNRSLTIAEAHGDALEQLRLLGPLNMFHLRVGDFWNALRHAERCSSIAEIVDDPVAVALAHAILGISRHLCGDLDAARTELEAAVQRAPRSRRTSTIYLGFESKSLAGVILARTLWLQGHPTQAVECARRTIHDAASMDHSLTLSIALIWGISLLLWTGDLHNAEEHIDWLITDAMSHSLGPYLAVARGFKGELAIRRGDAKAGVESLQDSLRVLHTAPYELLTTPLNIALAQGLAEIGRSSEGRTLIDETIRQSEVNGDICYMPELLRVRGSLLLSPPQSAAVDAEACFLQSLELSRAQGARAWELRTAVDLARLWAAQGRSADARTLLRPVFERFTEGHDTADLQAAERVLAEVN